LAADGSPVICDQKIEELQWQAQGHTLTSSVGILPLKCFDMILGQDWLESCSPMWVRWSKKLMKFTYKGKRISLQGLTIELAKYSNISGDKFQGLLNRRAITHMIQMQVKDLVLLTYDSAKVAVLQETPISVEIHKLIDVYQDVFQTPTAKVQKMQLNVV
jgi:hypothetical protein